MAREFNKVRGRNSVGLTHVPEVICKVQYPIFPFHMGAGRDSHRSLAEAPVGLRPPPVYPPPPSLCGSTPTTSTPPELFLGPFSSNSHLHSTFSSSVALRLGPAEFFSIQVTSCLSIDVSALAAPENNTKIITRNYGLPRAVQHGVSPLSAAQGQGEWRCVPVTANHHHHHLCYCAIF